MDKKLNTIGLPISHKENEKRRAIIPEHIRLMSHPECLYVETGYGSVLGIPDELYKNCGCTVQSREEVLSKDVICDPKIGDAEYLDTLSEGKIIFGWIHATQNVDITEKILNGRLTAYAWEKMYHNGRHIFWRNNELAGEAAIIHAYQCFGKMPYETKVAVIGRGNTARGVIKILNMLGANVIQYDRNNERYLRKEIYNYDVIVNCILWDVFRTDHIIYKEDLKYMKQDALIIDVSCDQGAAIESSRPTTIDEPTYVVDGILHYAVDHTPALFYKTFSCENSKIIYPFLDMLIKNEINETLKNALIIKEGSIMDLEIIKYQKR